MSWAVTDSVGTQLWLYKTCRVYFNQTGLDVNMLDDEDIDELNFYIYYRRHLPESQSSGKPGHEQQDPGAGEWLEALLELHGGAPGSDLALPRPSVR